MRLLWVYVLALIVAAPFTSQTCQAQESDLSGKWTVKVLFNGIELSVWLIDVEQKGSKVNAEVVDSFGGFKGSTIKSIQAKDGRLELVMNARGLEFDVVAYASKGQKSDTLFGSVLIRGTRDLVRLDRTDAKTIDQDSAQKKGPASDEYIKALRTTGEDAAAAYKKILKEHATDPVALKSAIKLLGLVASKADESELKTISNAALKVAKSYGPEVELLAYTDLASALVSAKKGDGLALEFAEKASKMLDASSPTAEKQGVLNVLAEAYRNAKQDAKAKAVEAEVAKLEKVLDDEFAKSNIPFTPKKYDGKAKRTVVVELFTGAECPPCVAADVAFDALLETYAAKDVTLIQYHLHIPGPDALTNQDAVDRSLYYMGGQRYTPYFAINGEKGPPVGGARTNAEDGYVELTRVINAELQKPGGGDLELQAKRDGDKITVSAKVSELDKTGKSVRLRLALVEEVVRYPGGNGQRLHHHVFRGFIGGEPGIALENKSGEFSKSIELKDLRKSLTSYLEDYASKREPFPRSVRPLDLTNLRIIGILQDNESKQILNAAQVNVP